MYISICILNIDTRVHTHTYIHTMYTYTQMPIYVIYKYLRAFSSFLFSTFGREIKINASRMEIDTTDRLLDEPQVYIHSKESSIHVKRDLYTRKRCTYMSKETCKSEWKSTQRSAFSQSLKYTETCMHVKTDV